MDSQKEGYYREDLAYIHDQSYSGVSILAADHLLQLLAQKDIHTGLVVDLGCGSGKLLRILADKKYQTLGLDYSNHLLRLAGLHSPHSSLISGSIWDFEIPVCNAIVSIGEVINYAFDNKNDIGQLDGLFRQAYKKLQSPGIFLFDIITTSLFEKDHPPKSASGPDWQMHVQYESDRKRKMFARDISVTRTLANGTERKSHEYHSVRLFDPVELEDMLQKTGFRTRVMDNYHGHDLRFGHVAFECIKE